MKTKTKVPVVAGLLLAGVFVILGMVWNINGRDDTWLYALCALIVLSSYVPMVSKNKDESK